MVEKKPFHDLVYQRTTEKIKELTLQVTSLGDKVKLFSEDPDKAAKDLTKEECTKMADEAVKLLEQWKSSEKKDIMYLAPLPRKRKTRSPTRPQIEDAPAATS